MTDITETSQTVAAGQLRAFIERIERVEEEIKTLNADKSEIYKELRGVGFDVKAVRQCVAARKLDSAEREERNAIFDLYWEALTGASRVHVHEEPKATATKTRADRASSGNTAKLDTNVPHDAETGEIFEQNSSAPTSSPELTDQPGTEPPPSVSGTNSEIPDHATSGAADGQPSKPSSEAARAKNDGPHKAVIGQEGPVRGHSEQAVTISDADVPAFLRKPPAPAPNPDCQKPQSCRWSHSQASCAKCANDAAIARQRGRAA
ncbi:DUF2312 domain-containing protein [Mesorhizobium huakuii 7653R]|nr:DUF2312 domain-containing protein [Mesorhizobium huakuii 7653R]